MIPRNEKLPSCPYPLKKTLLLIGMMGCGKSSLGSRLAKLYGLPFVDADDEVERAAGCSVSDLFERYGEGEFRRGEERVMERLLNGEICVLAAGGGSFLSEKTRRLAREKAVSVFLDADISTLIRHTAGRTHRPLLNCGEPARVLSALLEKRRPVYTLADIRVSYKEETMNQLVQLLIRRLNAYAGKEAE